MTGVEDLSDEELEEKIKELERKLRESEGKIDVNVNVKVEKKNSDGEVVRTIEV